MTSLHPTARRVHLRDLDKQAHKDLVPNVSPDYRAVAGEGEVEGPSSGVDVDLAVVAEEAEGHLLDGLIADFGALGDGDEGVPLQGFGQPWGVGAEELADGVAAGVGRVFVRGVFEPLNRVVLTGGS